MPGEEKLKEVVEKAKSYLSESTPDSSKINIKDQIKQQLHSFIIGPSKQFRFCSFESAFLTVLNDLKLDWSFRNSDELIKKNRTVTFGKNAHGEFLNLKNEMLEI